MKTCELGYQNMMWAYDSTTNLVKNRQSGLCLENHEKKRDGQVSMEPCDKHNVFQWWYSNELENHLQASRSSNGHSLCLSGLHSLDLSVPTPAPALLGDQPFATTIDGGSWETCGNWNNSANHDHWCPTKCSRVTTSGDTIVNGQESVDTVHTDGNLIIADGARLNLVEQSTVPAGTCCSGLINRFGREHVYGAEAYTETADGCTGGSLTGALADPLTVKVDYCNGNDRNQVFKIDMGADVIDTAVTTLTDTIHMRPESGTDCLIVEPANELGLRGVAFTACDVADLSPNQGHRWEYLAGTKQIKLQTEDICLHAQVNTSNPDLQGVQCNVTDRFQKFDYNKWEGTVISLSSLSSAGEPFCLERDAEGQPEVNACDENKHVNQRWHLDAAGDMFAEMPRSGQLQVVDGYCLRSKTVWSSDGNNGEIENHDASGEVETAVCNEHDAAQVWAYSKLTRQVRSQWGRCMTVGGSGSKVTMTECEADEGTNKISNQHFYYRQNSLQLRAGNSETATDCVHAEHPTDVDGIVTIEECKLGSFNQKLRFNPVEVTPFSHDNHGFCPAGFRVVNMTQADLDRDVIRLGSIKHKLGELSCLKCPVGTTNNGGMNTACHAPSYEWSVCSHTACRVESSDKFCTLHHSPNPALELGTLGSGNVTSQFACSTFDESRTRLVVYHHGFENQGTVHRCSIKAGVCGCECKVKQVPFSDTLYEERG